MEFQGYMLKKFMKIQIEINKLYNDVKIKNLVIEQEKILKEFGLDDENSK